MRRLLTGAYVRLIAISWSPAGPATMRNASAADRRYLLYSPPKAKVLKAAGASPPMGCGQGVEKDLRFRDRGSRVTLLPRWKLTSTSGLGKFMPSYLFCSRLHAASHPRRDGAADDAFLLPTGGGECVPRPGASFDTCAHLPNVALLRGQNRRVFARHRWPARGRGTGLKDRGDFAQRRGTTLRNIAMPSSFWRRPGYLVSTGRRVDEIFGVVHGGLRHQPSSCTAGPPRAPVRRHEWSVTAGARSRATTRSGRTTCSRSTAYRQP